MAGDDGFLAGFGRADEALNSGGCRVGNTSGVSFFAEPDEDDTVAGRDPIEALWSRPIAGRSAYSLFGMRKEVFLPPRQNPQICRTDESIAGNTAGLISTQGRGSFSLTD